MARRSRRYQKSREAVDRSHLYRLEEAVQKVKSMAPARFDETVECSVQLGIDPRHSDQQVRGSISLPHGTGKERTIAVFADGANAEAAREAGADIVGADDLIEKVEKGFLDFDVALATPDIMGRVGRLGRHLGPRGLMPSPKSGTVRADIAEAVQEFKAGKIEFRNDSGGNVHVPVGKLSFEVAALTENVQAVIDQLVRMKPAASKGRYLCKVCVASTMNPAVPVDIT
jgi:large subunit ribosomal protein L1